VLTISIVRRTYCTACRASIHAIGPGTAKWRGAIMAKGQVKSNREAKKPKKTEAEKLKAKSVLSNIQAYGSGDKDRLKKS
jgi:Zn-dependent M28 family amino/carboxypeptidase